MHLTDDHVDAAMERFSAFYALTNDTVSDPDDRVDACEAFYASVGFSPEFRERLYEAVVYVTGREDTEPVAAMMAALLALVARDEASADEAPAMTDDAIREALGL